jgi:hypothetical protein
MNITIELTDEEYDRFERAAQFSGLSLGAFLHKAAGAYCLDCWEPSLMPGDPQWQCKWCKIIIAGDLFGPGYGLMRPTIDHKPQCPAVKHLRAGGGE